MTISFRKLCMRAILTLRGGGQLKVGSYSQCNQFSINR